MRLKLNKNAAVEIISGLFIVLFVYTAISKLYQLAQFESALSKSPLLGQMSSVLSILVPVIELIISFLLFFPKYRKIGLYFSTALMVIFTGYLIYMIYFTPNLPCTCGGVLSSLSWKQHLIFNIVYTILGALSIVLIRKKDIISNSSSRSEYNYA